MHALRLIFRQARGFGSVFICRPLCRNVNTWNSLPEDIANCATVATFKRKLSSIDLSRFVIFNCFYCFNREW